MKTVHRIVYSSSEDMGAIEDRSIALMVTSPPYPMIGMWDEIFAAQTGVKAEEDKAFADMHAFLSRIWREADRALMEGGIACVNIGDATRTVGGQFRLYPNHSAVIDCFEGMGYSPLPAIIWRKQTNSPNKFMGSGMYPPGAYVTLEHEYILIFRKGGKRQFSTEEQKAARRRSSYFWEERNIWFSDLWDIKGVKQAISAHEDRLRSGAFPFELAYRLVNMFSVEGDVVLDPFLGTGTTALAAIASSRNSVGYEIDGKLSGLVSDCIMGSKDMLNSHIDRRMDAHMGFIEEKGEEEQALYANLNHGFRVKTRQETEMMVRRVAGISAEGDGLFAAEMEKWEPRTKTLF